MTTQITHKTKTIGGEVASIGGLGGYVHVETMTRKTWNDAAHTELFVEGETRIKAHVYHNGKRHELKWIGGNHAQVVNYWTVRIQKRLEQIERSTRRAA